MNIICDNEKILENNDRVYLIKKRENIRKEIQIFEYLQNFKELNNTYIKLYNIHNCTKGRNDLYKIMEMEKGIDYEHYIENIKNNKNVGIILRKNINTIINIYKEFLKHGILHNDLKPQNILIKSDNSIVLADFDNSIIFEVRDIIKFRENVKKDIIRLYELIERKIKLLYWNEDFPDNIHDLMNYIYNYKQEINQKIDKILETIIIRQYNYQTPQYGTGYTSYRKTRRSNLRKRSHTRKHKNHSTRKQRGM